MKTISIHIVFFIISIGLYAKGYNKTTLSGKITDKQTQEPIVGATIYIPDLKTGAVSDINGNYIINGLPNIKLLAQVRSVGYSTITEAVDLSIITTKDFVMTISIVEGHEIVVTGLSQASERNRTPTPISIVPKMELLQNASGNIIDAIAKKPGISQLGTGPGISKPVIRGLGYNRVVVVNDGIRQEGQQWGDEHGIEIDEFSINSVEILKGPASLAYGSDAMAGVISMVSAPTNPEGEIKGNVLANYQSNNGLIGYSGNVSGNIKGLIWDTRFSQKDAHGYRNKYDGYVYNSGFKETNWSGIVGVNKSWGYSHLHFHSQSNEAWFFHTPGLKIVYPAFPVDAKGLLLASFEDPNPILFFEHKALYRSITQDVPDDYYTLEIGKASVIKEGSDVSIITYGLGIHWALEVLNKHPELSADLVDLRTLLPLDKETIFNSVKKTGKVIILHEDTFTGGIGGELSALISENCFEQLDAPIVRSASLDTPVPMNADLETNFLPKERFEKQLLQLLGY